MIRFVCIAAITALISGCSTSPVASYSPLANGPIANGASSSNSEKAPINLGTSSITLEKLARHQGCEPVLGAALISQNGPTETYEIKCTSGQILGAHCEYRQCTLNAQTSPTVVASAAPATAATQPVVLSVAASANESTSLAPVQNETAPQLSADQGVETSTEIPQSLTIPARPLKLVLGTGIVSGGDTLLTAYYTNNTSTNLKAGSGVQIYVGFDDRLSEHFSVQGTAGYLTDNASGSNVTLKFNRFPIDLLGYYHLNRSWRIGGGIQLMESPKIDASGFAAKFSMNFNNAVGSVLEAEYLVNSSFGIKLRAVKESFTATGYTGSVSGNQAGIFFNVYY